MAKGFEVLKINRLKLNDELSDQASHFAHAAEEAEILYNELQKLELQSEIIGDEIHGNIRAKYRNVSVKIRPNETAMKAMIRADVRIKELTEKLRVAGHAYRIAKIKVEALKMRGEMLVSMAHNVRQEKKLSTNFKT